MDGKDQESSKGPRINGMSSNRPLEYVVDPMNRIDGENEIMILGLREPNRHRDEDAFASGYHCDPSRDQLYMTAYFTERSAVVALALSSSDRPVFESVLLTSIWRMRRQRYRHSAVFEIGLKSSPGRDPHFLREFQPRK